MKITQENWQEFISTTANHLYRIDNESTKQQIFESTKTLKITNPTVATLDQWQKLGYDVPNTLTPVGFLVDRRLYDISQTVPTENARPIPNRFENFTKETADEILGGIITPKRPFNGETATQIQAIYELIESEFTTAEKTDITLAAKHSAYLSVVKRLYPNEPLPHTVEILEYNVPSIYERGEQDSLHNMTLSAIKNVFGKIEVATKEFSERAEETKERQEIDTEPQEEQPNPYHQRREQAITDVAPHVPPNTNIVLYKFGLFHEADYEAYEKHADLLAEHLGFGVVPITNSAISRFVGFPAVSLDNVVEQLKSKGLNIVVAESTNPIELGQGNYAISQIINADEQEMAEENIAEEDLSAQAKTEFPQYFQGERMNSQEEYNQALEREFGSVEDYEIEEETVTRQSKPSQAPQIDWETFVAETKSNTADYTKPFVVIESSESPDFNEFERLSLDEADNKFKQVESKRRAEQRGGYDKTRGLIFFKDDPTDTELSTYYFRYDIGDYNAEQSGLYNHINNFWTNVQERLRNGEYALGATQEEIDDTFRMLNTFQSENEVTQQEYVADTAELEQPRKLQVGDMIYPELDDPNPYILTNLVDNKIMLEREPTPNEQDIEMFARSSEFTITVEKFSDLMQADPRNSHLFSPVRQGGQKNLTKEDFSDRIELGDLEPKISEENVGGLKNGEKSTNDVVGAAQSDERVGTPSGGNENINSDGGSVGEDGRGDEIPAELPTDSERDGGDSLQESSQSVQPSIGGDANISSNRAVGTIGGGISQNEIQRDNPNITDTPTSPTTAESTEHGGNATTSRRADSPTADGAGTPTSGTNTELPSQGRGEVADKPNRNDSQGESAENGSKTQNIGIESGIDGMARNNSPIEAERDNLHANERGSGGNAANSNLGDVPNANQGILGENGENDHGGIGNLSTTAGESRNATSPPNSDSRGADIQQDDGNGKKTGNVESERQGQNQHDASTSPRNSDVPINELATKEQPIEETPSTRLFLSDFSENPNAVRECEQELVAVMNAQSDSRHADFSGLSALIDKYGLEVPLHLTSKSLYSTKFSSKEYAN
ncbi:MAG: hypothetical protein FWG65_13240 [Turicibacter sp.]|nr:hypothetical protein [Turicibacter sp.]